MIEKCNQWNFYVSILAAAMNCGNYVDRANLWCPRIKKTEAGAFFLCKQRNRGSEAALVGGLCGAGVSGPRYKSSGTKILPRLSTQWWRVYFCPCFLGHFRPIFEPRCPRVPCYPPVDRSPHFGRTPATSELGLDWASFPRVGLRPDIGFSNIPAQMICPKICSRKSALKSASLAPLANPLHQARRNRSQSHHTRFLFILIIGLNFKIIIIIKTSYPQFSICISSSNFRHISLPSSYHLHIIVISS